MIAPNGRENGRPTEVRTPVVGERASAQRHYLKSSRGPLSGQPFTRDMIDVEAFWRRVEVGDGCWLWRGAINRLGYGFLYAPQLRRGPVAAHRAAYVIQHGQVPAGLSILHSCDNPPCVNPAHLRAGTHRENMDEAVARGRMGKPLQTHCLRGHLLPTDRRCVECNVIHQAKHRAQRNASAIVMGERAFHEHVEQHIAPRVPAAFSDLVAITGEKRATVVARLFGLFGYRLTTTQVLGAEMGVTRQRVQQLRNAALRTLGVEEDAIRQTPTHSTWKAKLIAEARS